MVLLRKTVTDFSNKIAASVGSRDTTVDTYIGPVQDVFITPFAEVFKDVSDNVVYLSQLQSLKYASRFNPEDLDDFVYNEGILRWTGSPSVAVVTFSRVEPPVADIFIPVNFPLGTTQNPKTGESVQFRTIESKTMYGPLVTPSSSYYNSDTGRYEISVTVSSVGKGDNTAVGANTITVFQRPFPDFEYVTNKVATTSGLARETNDDLAIRYRLQVRGNQEATPAGLKLFGLDNFASVEDAYVVYGNNPELTRQTDDAGAVDVWVKGATPLTATHDTTYPGIAELIPVPQQPLLSVISVKNGGVVFIQGLDYEVVTNEGVYAYSIQARSGIRFTSNGITPAVGDPITITYQYNALMNIISSLYRQPEYYVMGNNVLFRWAQPLFIELEATLKVKSGNPNDVLGLVRNRVLNYINVLKLGLNVEEFDIDAEVSRVYGVDNWVYTKLAVKGGEGVSDIDVSASQYPYINQADLIISLTS